MLKNLISWKFGVMYTQAANCALCVHVGSVAVYFLCGGRPRGYATRIELFTHYHRWRFGWGCVDEQARRERRNKARQLAAA